LIDCTLDTPIYRNPRMYIKYDPALVENYHKMCWTSLQF
jgi:hypothetical protein